MDAKRQVRQRPADTPEGSGRSSAKEIELCSMCRAEVVASGKDNSGKKWVVTTQVFPGQAKAAFRA